MKSRLIFAFALGVLYAAADSPSQDGVSALLDTLDSGGVTNVALPVALVPTNSAPARSAIVTNVVQHVEKRRHPVLRYGRGHGAERPERYKKYDARFQWKPFFLPKWLPWIIPNISFAWK